MSSNLISTSHVTISDCVDWRYNFLSCFRNKQIFCHQTWLLNKFFPSDSAESSSSIQVQKAPRTHSSISVQTRQNRMAPRMSGNQTWETWSHWSRRHRASDRFCLRTFYQLEIWIRFFFWIPFGKYLEMISVWEFCHRSGQVSEKTPG